MSPRVPPASRWGTGRSVMIHIMFPVIRCHRKVGDASAAGAEREGSPKEHHHVLEDFNRAETSAL